MKWLSLLRSGVYWVRAMLKKVTCARRLKHYEESLQQNVNGSELLLFSRTLRFPIIETCEQCGEFWSMLTAIRVASANQCVSPPCDSGGFFLDKQAALYNARVLGNYSCFACGTAHCKTALCAAYLDRGVIR